MKKYLLSLLIAVSISPKNQAQRAIPVFAREINDPRVFNSYQKGMYYFLPDIDVYYYAPAKEFVYLNNGEWFFSRSLPAKYNGFDLYNCYKIRINTERPYLENEYYQTKYAAYRGVQYNKYNSEALAENYRAEERGQQPSRERYINWYNNFRKNSSTNEQYTAGEEQTNFSSRINSAPEKYQPSYQPQKGTKNIQKEAEGFDPYVETTPRENNSYMPPPAQVKPASVKTQVTNAPASDKPAAIKPQPLPAVVLPVQDTSITSKPVAAGVRSAYGSWDKKKPADQ